MSKKTIPIYGGEIKAHTLGSFVMGGEVFHVIRPGYCIQGKRRTAWTQIVHEDIPIYGVRNYTELSAAIAQFEGQWKKYIGDDKVLLGKALASCKKEHRRKFRDGESGEAPAPTVTRDGRGQGKRYPS